MKMDRSTRFNLRSQNFVMGLILTILLGLAAYASHRHQIRWDWTKGGRHTLAEQSLKAVKAFSEGLTLTVFVQERRDDRKQQIQDLMEKYQVANPSLTVRYVDPDLDPAAARQAEVAVYGTVILRAGEKTEKVTESTEEAITNGLIRLAKGSAKTIRFVTGHGEHSLNEGRESGNGQDRFAYTQAKALLKGEGYQIEEINLAETEKIPDNTAVVIVGGPKKAFLPIETARLKNWYDASGRLLLLLGPEGDAGLESILKPHGITLLKGVTIDPAAQMLAGSAATPVVSRYPPEHAITKGMSAATIFPDTGGLELEPAVNDGKEQRTRLLEGAARGWLETGDLTSGKVEFTPGEDRKGPILMGAAVQADKRRLVVTTNSNFLADAYVSVLGNADLFLNIARWLAEDENFIAIKPKEVQDAGLTMSGEQSLLLFLGLVVLVPLGLLTIGGIIWFKRRRR
ncbi:MAG: GldG family protein [Magnetococcus sp. YQC-9]